MGIFENDDELAEAEREGWLRNGKWTAAGVARMKFEVSLRDSRGKDPRQVCRATRFVGRPGRMR
jgi:hypothetical protein